MTKNTNDYLTSTLDLIDKCVEEISYLRGIKVEGDEPDEIQKELLESDGKLSEVGTALKNAYFKLSEFISEQEIIN